MPVSNNRLRRSRLSAALCLVFALSVVQNAQAARAAAAQESASTATDLDAVTVTGSLIPQTQLENFTPVTVVSAEDIQARGFTSVADVLQQSSFQTGGLQGGQTSASFTQGAEAAGMFGLDPGYTKYLIDGRPMANYPALYNGSDTFNNISGIPVDLVDRIEILPGGQSSLYGSDAIAGVVNVILKKHADGLSLNVRGGMFSEGGGDSLRVTASEGFGSADGRFNLAAGLQYETRDPIWGHQRALTREFNVDGYTAQTASRDYLITNGSARNTYVFADPSRCANVGGQFDGSEQLSSRAGLGQYCGSFLTPGYRTIRNGKDALQGYAHATFDVNDNVQLYGDLLASHEDVDYATGSSYTWWGTGAKYGYFYDPDRKALLNLQRAFSPEDIGGLGFADIMNTDRNRSWQLTLGAQGRFGASAWDWDVGVTSTRYELTEHRFARFADAIDAYFVSHVLGPQLGVNRGYPVFRPDYAAFYSPMSPSDFASFTGYVDTRSETKDDTLRAQFTNASLFPLPGGEAGLAVVVEGGKQGWDYTPDARLLQDPVTLKSGVWGQTSVSGSGDRDRYAVTGELRLPLWNPLTVTLSGRYDAFDVGGQTIDKPTYSLGVEYRPVESILLRGKYGTAFRAPTLSDVFQGLSGFYGSNTDYYRCSLDGYVPGNTTGCAYDNTRYFGQQSGNPELRPIEADVWNAGVVYAPASNFSLSVDYFRWDIRDEVDQLSADQLLLAEYFCRTGQANTASAGCDNALAWVTRGPNDEITRLYTPKVNVSQQMLGALTVSLNYVLDLARWGSLAFAGNYTNNLEHTVTPLPGDEPVDLLRDPYAMWLYDAYAKTRADASLAWSLGRWTTTAYANRIGSTPNYLAYTSDSWDYQTNGQHAGRWAPYTTWNLSFNYDATDFLRLSLLVNNVLDKMPDAQAATYPGTTATPYNSGLYNPYGRSMYLEMRYRFGQ
ncbi:TonB-dependent receptor plug domain-containing protein [Lysobacter soli]|uniref:TonB-dependent receptor n=1 Tax=Lysobacter soli TaxID=453783 RepID=A0A3D8VJB9_9GAMM|nr:TonB-dependent receptor [Lysobacter soli]